MTPVVNLITGATGFVGGYLVEHLLRRGEIVRALVRKTSPIHRLEKPGVDFFYGDLLDLDALKAAVRGINYIYHLGEIRIRERDSDKKNVAAVATLAEAAKNEAGFKRMVFISALTVVSVPVHLPADENTPVDPKRKVDDYHTRYKRDSEQVLAASGISASVVRAGAIYGPGAGYLLSFHRLCRRLKIPLPYPGNPDIRFASIHVEDLAAILYAAAHYQGSAFRIFHAVDDNQGTVRDFVKSTYGAAGVNLRLWKMSYRAQLAGAKLLDPLVALKLPGNNFSSIVYYQGFDQDFSNRRIKDELGVVLRHPTWESGMPGTAQWLRDRLARP